MNIEYIKTDSAFRIGKTHDVCEDFALTGSFNTNDAHYAIVSDGCSSSPQVDLGARILSHSIVNELKNLYRNSATLMFSFNSDTCMTKARASIDSLKISPDSLDATALVAYYIDDFFEILVKGDGCIAFGLEDGRILVSNFEFPNGFPFYMNYLPKYTLRFQQWLEEQIPTTPCIVTSSIINIDGTYEQLDDHCSPDFTFRENKKSSIISVRKDKYGGSAYFWTEKTKPPKFVVLMSDGINSFYKTVDSGTSLTNSNIDYREVIYRALSFKNFNGKFMQRKLNRFLKFCIKNNWHHSDDISFGAMYFGD